MIAKILFLGAFAGGLALAVYSMLHGVERASGREARRPSAVFNAPIAAVFAIASVAVGYLLVTRTTLAFATIVILALVAASVLTLSAIAGFARWALPYSGAPSDEDTTQGALAVVTRAISPSEVGEISYQAQGIELTIAAKSLQGAAIPRDSEVVIDTIEDGIAQVELWSSVEQRL